MPLTWTETFERIAAHYAALTMTPGCWAYARQQVASLEACPDHGQHWQGLRAEVGRRIKAAGYQPRQDEMGEWWNVPSRSPASRPRLGG